jgi:DNA-binding transcriptional MocR family regulator
VSRSKPLPYAAMPHAMTVDLELTDGAYRLYALIERCAWKTGSTNVSQDTLADALGVSKDTIQRRLGELIEVGLITSERRGRGMTNLLSLAPVDEVYEPEVSDLPAPRKRKRRVSEAAQMRRQNMQNGGFSKKEEMKKHSEQQVPSSASPRVLQESDSESEASSPSRTKDRILAKVSRQMVDHVSEMGDAELWSLYARAQSADFLDQGQELREANTQLAGSVAEEIRKRTLD